MSCENSVVFNVFFARNLVLSCKDSVVFNVL